MYSPSPKDINQKNVLFYQRIVILTDGSGDSELAIDPPGAPVHDGAPQGLYPLPLVITIGFVSLDNLDWDTVTN